MARFVTKSFTLRCFIAFAGSFWMGAIWASLIAGGSYEKPAEQERRRRWDLLAGYYDPSSNRREWMYRIPAKRKEIGERAKGKVLEVAAGTGRNTQYYNNEVVTHLTLSETSKAMLKKAFTKKRSDIKTDFCLMNSVKLDFPDETFDTVVQTFGICSYERPKECLEELARVVKKDGEIILLEHGRSSWDRLAKLQDKRNCRRIIRKNCFGSRDIIATINEANLEIIEVQRWYLGVWTYVIARKRRDITETTDDSSIQSLVVSSPISKPCDTQKSK
eukprot:GHVN01021662.1.p1 GENE.GHVN01021662.1~~GHVN01021662.1.p1  ORF type:complete len:275 (-),score=41.99 GHVN01021662.1:209-1033(-)